MTDLRQASVRGVAWNLVQNLVGRLLGLVVVAVLARMLDASAFGAVAVALAVNVFAEAIVSVGCGDFITQRPEITETQLDTAFWLNVMVGVGLAGAVAALAGPIASLSEDSTETVTPIIQLLSLSIVIRSLSVVPGGLLVRRMQFRSLSLRSMIAAAIGGVVGIGSALAGLGAYALVTQTLVSDLAAVVILWRAAGWRPRWRFSRPDLHAIVAFGAPILAGALLNSVSRRADPLVIAWALGVTALGTYTMGQRIYQIATQVLNKSGDTVAFSALSRLADSEDRRRAALGKAIEVTAVLCFPIYGLLALLAEPFVATMLGGKWIESVPVLGVFALCGLPISLSWIHGAAIRSAGRTRYFLLLQIATLAIYVPLLFALVHLGPVAAAAAYLISCLVILPIEVAFVRAIIGIQVGAYVRSLGGAFAATVVACAATFACGKATSQLVPVVQLGIDGVVGVVAYVVALRVVAPGTFERSREVALGIFRRRRRVEASAAKDQP